MFLEALDASGLSLEYRDLVIVTSKVVSKSEGRSSTSTAPRTTRRR